MHLDICAYIANYKHHSRPTPCICSVHDCPNNQALLRIVMILNELANILHSRKFGGHDWKLADFFVGQPVTSHIRRLYMQSPNDPNSEFTSKCLTPLTRSAECYLIAQPRVEAFQLSYGLRGCLAFLATDYPLVELPAYKRDYNHHKHTIDYLWM